MQLRSSFRPCAPITRPAVPSGRLADESVTLAEAQEKYQKIPAAQDAFSRPSRGGLMAAKRQRRTPSREEVIIKRLTRNTDGLLFFFLLFFSPSLFFGSRWRKVIIKLFRPHLAGRKPPALLQPEQPSAEMSPRRLSRVPITLSRGRPDREEDKRSHVNAAAAA